MVYIINMRFILSPVYLCINNHFIYDSWKISLIFFNSFQKFLKCFWAHRKMLQSIATNHLLHYRCHKILGEEYIFEWTVGHLGYQRGN